MASSRADLGEQTIAVLDSYSVAQNFKNLLSRSADELGVSNKVDSALKAALGDMLENGISKQTLVEDGAALRSR